MELGLPVRGPRTPAPSVLVSPAICPRAAGYVRLARLARPPRPCQGRGDPHPATRSPSCRQLHNRSSKAMA